MHRLKFKRLLENLGIIVGLFAAAIGIAVVVVEWLEPVATVPRVVNAWLLVSIGILLPAFIMAICWARCENRDSTMFDLANRASVVEKDRLAGEVQSLSSQLGVVQTENANLKTENSDLRAELANLSVEIREALAKSVQSQAFSVHEGNGTALVAGTAWHLLTTCHNELGLITLGFIREHGPNFKRAKENQTSALQLWVKTCESRFFRDKAQLERLSRGSNILPIEVYVRGKQSVLKKLNSALEALQRPAKGDAAKMVIRATGEILQECWQSLESEIDALAAMSITAPPEGSERFQEPNGDATNGETHG